MSQTYNLGKVAVTPRGAYSSTAQYTPLDIFSYNGSSYLVLQNCMGVTPPNSTYYQVLAQKGTNGQNGSAANIAAGTVTMLPVGSQATVTNSGTSGNAIFNFGIPYSSISDNSVSTAKIVDSAVTTNKIADEAVTTDELQDRAVTTDKLQDRAVTTNKIADGAVGEDELSSGAVRLSKLASDVTEVLDYKANVDGAYEQMTVGNAEQLVSTVGVTDEAPYLFRTSGGSADIGDRETDEIVGGTVAWNQLLDGSADANWAANNATKSFSDGICTFTASAKDGYVQLNVAKTVVNHCYLAIVDIKETTATNLVALNFYGGDYKYCEATTNWQRVASINKRSASNNNFNMRVSDRRTSGWDAIQVKNFMLFDLTLMFGTTIADYVYTLETSTSGSGVAWLQNHGFFTRPYYSSNTGTLMSVNTSAHKTVGFNLLNTFLGYKSSPSYVTFNTANAVRVINGMEYEFNHGVVSNATTWRHAVVCYDLNGTKMSDSGLLTVGSGGMYYNLSGRYYVNSTNGTRTSDKFTPNFDGFVIPFIAGGDASDSTTVQNPCVHLVWDGEKDGDYEAYELNTYALDSSLTLRGIPHLDKNNNLYYDGDTYESNGTVTRNYGIVDLGTLTWKKGTGATYFATTVSGIKRTSGWNAVPNNIICPPYMPDTANNVVASTTDKTMSVAPNADTFIIYDSTYASSTKEQFKTAMSGVYLVYELATPTTETADAFTNPQIVYDWGTEEYVDYGYYQGTRDVEVPVGHTTLYSANLRAKLEMQPNSPDGDGLYAVRQSGGINTYEEIIFPTELPSAPTSDGTYRLVCTVADGVATYSWAAN